MSQLNEIRFKTSSLAAPTSINMKYYGKGIFVKEINDNFTFSNRILQPQTLESNQQFS